jgi:hypothetical protein
MLKVEVNEIVVELQKQNHYPCLKKSKDKVCIVLFTSPNQGFLVGGEKISWAIGTTGKYWDEKDFEKFNGTITLSNG